jgi:hypothetical protein
MADLTLEECLTQSRGYEGRLFETPENSLGIEIPGERNFTNVYRILKVEGDKMNIEGYLLGGSFVVIKNLSVTDRLQDKVINSEHLMEWYKMAGRAGQAGLF